MQNLSEVSFCLPGLKAKQLRQYCSNSTGKLYVAGFRSLKATSLDKLKKALVHVEEELRDPDIFEDFFKFSFKFCLTVSLGSLSLCPYISY